MRTISAFITFALAATGAAAHEGHGLPGVSHWHASDTFGLMLLLVGATALAWWRGRK